MPAKDQSAATIRDADGVYRIPVSRTVLRDQYGLRIVHCHNAEPHHWHGWVGGNEDLRCPGVATYKDGQRV